MAVINGTNYRLIAVDYATAYDNAIEVKDYLFEAVYQVVLLDSIQPEVDLLTPYWDSYQVNAPVYSSQSSLLGAVRAIQAHVLKRGSYATVDAYLAAEGITVPATWATLSATAGYPISDTYID